MAKDLGNDLDGEGLSGQHTHEMFKECKAQRKPDVAWHHSILSTMLYRKRMAPTFMAARGMPAAMETTIC